MATRKHWITFNLNTHADILISFGGETVKYIENVRVTTFELEVVPTWRYVISITPKDRAYLSHNFVETIDRNRTFNITLQRAPVTPPAQHWITFNLNTHANITITRERDLQLIRRFDNTKVITTDVPADRYNFVIHQIGFITQRWTETINRNRTFNITLIREKEPPIRLPEPPIREPIIIPPKQRIFRLTLNLHGQVYRLQPIIPRIQRIVNPIFSAAGFTIRQIFIRDKRLIIEVIK